MLHLTVCIPNERVNHRAACAAARNGCGETPGGQPPWNSDPAGGANDTGDVAARARTLPGRRAAPPWRDGELLRILVPESTVLRGVGLLSVRGCWESRAFVAVVGKAG